MKFVLPAPVHGMHMTVTQESVDVGSLWCVTKRQKTTWLS